MMSPPWPPLILQITLMVVNSWDERSGPLYRYCDPSLGIGCPLERDVTLGKIALFHLKQSLERISAESFVGV